MTSGEAFRALHANEGAFIMPNPWDAGTARILAAMGFPALATTSAGMAFALGVRDGGVTRKQALDHCRTMVAATNLPVSADLENGFGDSPESVVETIHAAAGLGLAGCSIEDYTNDDREPIYEFGLAVERIRAAVDARRNLPEDFVLTARCENLIRGRDDLAGTIERLQAFGDAGADVLYAPGLRDLESIRTVCAAVDKPVNVLMGLSGATFTAADVAAAGAKRISIGGALARAAFSAVVDAAREMKEEGTFTFAPRAIGTADLQSFFSSP